MKWFREPRCSFRHPLLLLPPIPPSQPASHLLACWLLPAPAQAQKEAAEPGAQREGSILHVAMLLCPGKGLWLQLASQDEVEHTVSCGGRLRGPM